MEQGTLYHLPFSCPTCGNKFCNCTFFSYYFDPDEKSCQVVKFPVGIVWPDWLKDAKFLGTEKVGHFDCYVWTKLDFITYYEDIKVHFSTLLIRLLIYWWCPFYPFIFLFLFLPKDKNSSEVELSLTSFPAGYSQLQSGRDFASWKMAGPKLLFQWDVKVALISRRWKCWKLNFGVASKPCVIFFHENAFGHFRGRDFKN